MVELQKQITMTDINPVLTNFNQTTAPPKAELAPTQPQIVGGERLTRKKADISAQLQIGLDIGKFQRNKIELYFQNKSC